jgi:uncharacterized protein
MRVAVTGSTGLIGSALTAHLRAGGHEVVPVVRRPPSVGEIGWDPAAGTVDAAAFAGIDAVVHLAGAGIGDRRWTDAYKREILESRTRSTNLLCEAISSIDGGPRRLLSGSAIGFYGARGDEELDEASTRGTGFLADVVVDWESSAAMAVAAGISVAYLRTGIVLSAEGGALKKQLPLFKLGLGGRFGDGKQWQSWISITDEVRAIEHLLTSDLTGPVNLTAPAPVTGAEFATTLGAVLHRPAKLPVPGFGPKLVLGGELATALLLSGQRVLPTALQADGFTFEHPDLESALRALLGRPA